MELTLTLPSSGLVGEALEGLDYAHDLGEPSTRSGRVRVTDHGSAREGSVTWVTMSGSRTRTSGSESRPEASRAAAVRKIRRYVVANDLSLAFTASYRVAADGLPQLRADVGRFLVRVRNNAFDGARMPSIYVPEFGKRGRLHAHLLLPDLDPRVLASSWTWGHSHADPLPDVEDQRTFAQYLGKFFDSQPPGTRRYEPARGFMPQPDRFFVDSLDEGYSLLRDLHFSEAVTHSRRSASTGAGTLFFGPS